jgi:hypothetical protein
MSVIKTFFSFVKDAHYFQPSLIFMSVTHRVATQVRYAVWVGSHIFANDSKVKVHTCLTDAVTLSITTLSVMTLSIITFIIETGSIMTINIMILSIMTPSIMTPSIMTPIIMTLSTMTLSIMGLSASISLNENQHKL